MRDKILLTNIQRFSLHDGPGIRTTVFLKGCSIRCPWCANPENIVARPQKYVKDGIEGVYGKEYSCDEIYDEVTKDAVYYGGGDISYDIKDVADLNKLPGGVTFSGGECLLQIRNLEPLLQRLKEKNIHITIETSLFIPRTFLCEAISFIDLFYVDIKILDENKCYEILNGKLQLFLSNLQILLDSGRPIVFRIPVIGGITDSNKNRSKIIELLKKSKGNVLKVELLKGHNLGVNKYQSLIDGGTAIALPKYSDVSDEFMEQYRDEIKKVIDVPIELCKV